MISSVYKELKIEVQTLSATSTKNECAFTTPESNKSDHQSYSDFSPSKNFKNSPFSSNTSSPNKEVLSDRFIPVRAKNSSKTLFELSDQLMIPPEKLEVCSEETKNKMKFNSLLENQLLDVKHSEFFSKFKNPPRNSPLMKNKQEFLAEQHCLNGLSPQHTASHTLSKRPKMLHFKTPLKENGRHEHIHLSRFMDIEKEEQESVLETFKT